MEIYTIRIRVIQLKICVDEYVWWIIWINDLSKDLSKIKRKFKNSFYTCSDLVDLLDRTWRPGTYSSSLSSAATERRALLAGGGKGMGSRCNAMFWISHRVSSIVKEEPVEKQFFKRKVNTKKCMPAQILSISWSELVGRGRIRHRSHLNPIYFSFLSSCSSSPSADLCLSLRARSAWRAAESGRYLQATDFRTGR